MTDDAVAAIIPTQTGERSGASSAGSLAICIPTYRRAHLLTRLIADLGRQTRPIARLIVVDGDPESEEVHDILPIAARAIGAETLYVPSNHGNISYQRYLGWRAAAGCDVLLYLDDDLRIPQPDAVERVVGPLLVDKSDVVGVTARLRFGELQESKDGMGPVDPGRLTRSVRAPRIVRWLGSARSIPPGGLTPAGNRRMPENGAHAYVGVDWLHGGVMAYRMDAITRESFSADLFALYHIRSGKGEDTILSRRVGYSGRLLYARCATFDHPSEGVPTAYPTAAYRLGHAVAYSRRLLNDHYRGFDRPTFRDRWSLVRTYAGTVMVNLSRALRPPRKQRFAYAAGYGFGAVRGLVAPPRARRLTPGIDWWGDADVALAGARRIETRS